MDFLKNNACRYDASGKFEKKKTLVWPSSSERLIIFDGEFALRLLLDFFVSMSTD